MNNKDLLEELKLNIALLNFAEEIENREDTLKREVFMKKRILATCAIAIFMCCTLVFAQNYIVNEEKIWKEPESYTYDEMINNLPSQEISVEEKNELIDEETAKEKGLEILEKLGYKDQEINRIEIKRGYYEDIPSYYMVKTKWGYEEGLLVQLSATNGDFIGFYDMDLKYKHYESEDLPEEKIAELAKQYYNLLNFGDNYQLSKAYSQDYYFQNQGNKLLEGTFNKYYDGIKNPYEYVAITFLSVNGETKLNSIGIGIDSTFENNKVVITEQEAINIAKAKENELSPYEITNIKCELAIEKMNTYIYQLENNLYDPNENAEEKTYYKTEDIARKVWKVKVEHDVSPRGYENRWKEYYKEGTKKYYFVDTTTGEIIGGQITYFDD